MLIDVYAHGWLDELASRASSLPDRHELLLLIDGAFVPGLHRRLPPERTALLFETLPGCSDQVRDVSPFLTPLILGDAALVKVLRQCDRWPMLSSIETPETLAQLASRLAAWCIVESDGQRFNFRFADTRRLPGIVQALNGAQRSQFAGPVLGWSYVGREGAWRRLEFESEHVDPASDPRLSDQQFARMVDDSFADEVMAALALRGCAVRDRPSQSYARISHAIAAARAASLPDEEVLNWCEWLWWRGWADAPPDLPVALDQYLASLSST